MNVQRDIRSPRVHVGVSLLARSDPGGAVKAPFSTSCASGRLYSELRSRREESQMSWITWYECPAVSGMEQRHEPFSIAITKRPPQRAAGLRADAGRDKNTALRQKGDGGVKWSWRLWSDVALFKCGAIFFL